MRKTLIVVLAATAAVAGGVVRRLRVDALSYLSCGLVAGGLGHRYGMWVSAITWGVWLGVVDYVRGASE